MVDTKICAIFVTFYPDREMLTNAVCAVFSQVDKIVLVDNTDHYHYGVVQNFAARPVEKIFLKKNKGIAAGHNAGIFWAKEHGYSHVLLMDQDSLASENMVPLLLSVEQKLLSEKCEVAAVGPNVLNIKQNAQMPFLQRKRGFIRSFKCESVAMPEVVHLISSGSLIRIFILDMVGGMDEALFIDYVDIEWGLRAFSKGCHCYGVCAATLFHQLGAKKILVPALGNRQLILHNALRYYYQFRNGILLFKRPYVALDWILYDAVIQKIIRFFLFLFFSPAPLQNTGMMLKGVLHAIRGVNGAFR